MRLNGRGTTALLVGAAVGACTAPASEAPTQTASDSADVRIVTSDPAAVTSSCGLSTEPTRTLGVAEGEEAYQFYRAFGASRLSDGRIVVADQGSHQLRYFDAAGTHLMSVGREGQGPGENQNLFGLWAVAGDTVWAGDYRPWRFHVYAPDGAWVRTVTPRPTYGNPPREWGMLSDGTSVLGGTGFNPEGSFTDPELVTAVIHGPSGEALDTLGSYPYGHYSALTEGGPRVFIVFEPFSRIAARGERILVSTAADPEVRVLDRTGTLTELVRWTDETRRVEPEDVQALYDGYREQYADLDPATRERLLTPLVSEERPVANVFPALSALMLGADGRIWVKRYPRPRDVQRNQWLVFGADGALQCHATLPDEVEVYDVGADYLLGKRETALGVEQFVMYGLAAGEGS